MANQALKHRSSLVILNTCPDKDTAIRIANTLIDKRLAACVNILPPMTSVYRWRGQVETGEEFLLLIKSTETAYDSVQAAIREIHPYELPEIVAVPIIAGLDAYLSWIDDSVQIHATP